MCKSNGGALLHLMSAARIAAAVLLTTFGSNSRAQQNDDSAIVTEFFPQKLIDEAALDFKAPLQATDLLHFSAFVAADLDGTGTADYLVAAYTNGGSGAVRVIKKRGASGLLVSEPSLPKMAGIFPGVTLIDLDGDGRPEIVITFTSGTGLFTDLIFKWDGANLNFIGPSEIDADGDIWTTLNEAAFINLNGEANFQIVNPPDTVDSSADPPIFGPYTVYTLSHGVYVPENVGFDFFKTFTQGKGATATKSVSFSIAHPDIASVITVATGEAKIIASTMAAEADHISSPATASAELYLNGNQIALPRTLNPKGPALEIPVVLKWSNTISVKLTGSPGSEVTIGVGPK